jgi:hypothetical protein
MEDYPVVKTLLGEHAKILSGFRRVLLKQFEFDRAFVGLNGRSAIRHQCLLDYRFKKLSKLQMSHAKCQMTNGNECNGSR